MKFCIKDDLSLFEFHGSVFSLVSFDGKDLVVSVSMMNIHKNTPQNPSDYDMEIDSAQITFQNFGSVTYESGCVWKIGEDGKSYSVGPRVVYHGQDGIDRILEELKNDLTVYHFAKEDRGYTFDGCGIDPYFSIFFHFDHVLVCWDEYKKKAWYELHQQYQYDAVLHTQNGDEAVHLIVRCHAEPAYTKRMLNYAHSVTVSCVYDGKEYRGHGSDYLWIDAFADLQRQLPKGIWLKCCLTCRHGNQCPVGDAINEVFCTKDVSITQKSDLYFYTEDDKERKKHSKQYCDLCEAHQLQTDDFYTYSDYLHYLNKE